MVLAGEARPLERKRTTSMEAPTLLLLGANHRTVPIEERERLLRRVRYARLRTLAGPRPPWMDLVLLTTCNRIEAYALAGEPAAALRVLEDAFAIPSKDPRVYVLRDREAAAHLFRVAAGLDSLAQGEGQVTAQVRRAAEDRPAPWRRRTELTSLFARAARAAPRVRRLAGLKENGTSASHAAIRFVGQVVRAPRPRVLLLGTGKMARIGAEALKDRADVIVLNRDAAKARTVARSLGGRGAGMERLASELAQADVVIAATSTRKPLITPRLLQQAARHRDGHPLWLIDLGFPRNIDARCGSIEGATLVDMDALAPWGAQSLSPVPRARAEDAIHEEARKAVDLVIPRAALDVAAFRRTAETVRLEEVQRALARLPALSDADRQVVDKLAARLVNRFLHGPTERLRALPEEARGLLVEELVAGLRETGGETG